MLSARKDKSVLRESILCIGKCLVISQVFLQGGTNGCLNTAGKKMLNCDALFASEFLCSAFHPQKTPVPQGLCAAGRWESTLQKLL